MTGETVTTTERSIRIVEEIKRQDGGTLQSIAENVNFSRSTVHKHLRTLIRHGLLSKEGEVYVFGLKFLNYGEYARSRKSEYKLTADAVQDIFEETNEEVDFIVENDGRGIIVHESYHPQSQYQTRTDSSQSGSHVGTYYHLHSVASGKAILAELPEERLREIKDEWGLPARTDQTITSMPELREELATIRERGIAFSDEEYAEGMRAVGRRIKSPDGSLLGAISLTAPTYRMTDDIFTQQVPKLLSKRVETLEQEIEDAISPS